MEKIGIIYGIERSFPPALMDKINEIAPKNIQAEMISIGALKMNETLEYTVIMDRVSHEVPYYRTLLKTASLNGTRIINNPFWSCADDNFFHAALADKIGIRFPKTVVLPSKKHPMGTTAESMRNLQYPLDWDEVFEYVGFPALLNPNKGSAFFNTYRVFNKEEFFQAYELTGSDVMILQEAMDYQKYYRSFIIGREDVRVIEYNPSQPQFMRYSKDQAKINNKIKTELEETSRKLCQALGFAFNAIDFALVDDKLYTIDFINPLPNAEKAYLHEDNFEWLVESTAKYLISLAKKGKKLSSKYTWSRFLNEENN